MTHSLEKLPAVLLAVRIWEAVAELDRHVAVVRVPDQRLQICLKIVSDNRTGELQPHQPSLTARGETPAALAGGFTTGSFHGEQFFTESS
jgi:hypothetical protein